MRILKGSLLAHILILDLLIVNVLHADGARVILHNLLYQLKLIIIFDLYRLYLSTYLLAVLLKSLLTLMALRHLLRPIGSILLYLAVVLAAKVLALCHYLRVLTSPILIHILGHDRDTLGLDPIDAHGHLPIHVHVYLLLVVFLAILCR